MTIQNDIYTEEDVNILSRDIIHILNTLNEPIRVVWGTFDAMQEV